MRVRLRITWNGWAQDTQSAPLQFVVLADMEKQSHFSSPLFTLFIMAGWPQATH